jgi:hypothetical protein
MLMGLGNIMLTSIVVQINGDYSPSGTEVIFLAFTTKAPSTCMDIILSFLGLIVIVKHMEFSYIM